MCIVSNVHDHYAKYPKEPWFTDEVKTYFTITKQPIEIFEELIEVAKRLDAALGLPDCESVSKTEWIKKLKEQIAEHAAKQLNKRLNGK